MLRALANSSLSSVINLIGLFVVNVIIARLISVDARGQLALMQAISIILASVSGLGVGRWLVHELNIEKKLLLSKSSLKSALSISLSLMVVMAISLVSIYRVDFVDIGMVVSFGLIIMLSSSLCIHGQMWNFFLIEKSLKSYSLLKIIFPMFLLVGLFVLWALNAVSLISVIILYFISNIASVIIVLFSTFSKDIHEKIKITSFKNEKSIDKSFWYIEIINVLMANIDKLIFALILPMKHLALYTIAYSIIKSFNSVFQAAIHSFYVNLYSATNIQIKNRMVLIVTSVAMITVFMFVLLDNWGGLAFEMIFGEKYAQSAVVAKYLIFEPFFLVISMMVSQIFIRHGLSKINFNRQVVILIITAPVMYFLTKEYGLYGAVAAVLILSVIKAGLSLYHLYKYSLLKLKA